MTLPYNPEEAAGKSQKKGGTVPPGNYPFTVDKAEEKFAKTSGNKYTKLTLSVDTGERKITVWENISYVSQALFKLDEFKNCTGIEWPDNDEDFVGASGVAKFIAGDGGYLEVKDYLTDGSISLTASEASAAATAPTSKEEIDEIPF